MSAGVPGDLEETVAREPRSTAEGLLARLRDLGWTVGIAESVTGGLVASSLIAVPGASDVVRGGIVAYATDLKQTLLGVDATLLRAHGPVNPRVAVQMADGVRDALAGAGTRPDVGIATTGIAGPTSPDGQPVGTVHIGVSTPLGTRVESVVLSGGRVQIRAEAADLAIRCALAAL